MLSFVILFRYLYLPHITTLMLFKTDASLAEETLRIQSIAREAEIL